MQLHFVSQSAMLETLSCYAFCFFWLCADSFSNEICKYTISLNDTIVNTICALI